MTCRRSVPQDEITKLVEGMQTTSMSCSRDDKVANPYDEVSKKKLGATVTIEPCLRRYLDGRIFKKPYQKRGATEDQRRNLATHFGQKLVSPSDSLLSPCSRKLNDHKSKLLATKSQPKRLDFAQSKQNVPPKSYTDI